MRGGDRPFFNGRESNGFKREQMSYEVCVIGGGMAGICAAIASARSGVKTVLVHDRPILGGNASSEVRMWICGAHGPHLKEAGILARAEPLEVPRANQNRKRPGFLEHAGAYPDRGEGRGNHTSISNIQPHPHS